MAVVLNAIGVEPVGFLAPVGWAAVGSLATFAAASGSIGQFGHAGAHGVRAEGTGAGDAFQRDRAALKLDGAFNGAAREAWATTPRLEDSTTSAGAVPLSADAGQPRAQAVEADAVSEGEQMDPAQQLLKDYIHAIDTLQVRPRHGYVRGNGACIITCIVVYRRSRLRCKHKHC